MKSKLNHSSIEAYSLAYAKKVTTDFFRDHETIKGKEIVNLCNIKQINFFVLKILFQEWKKETAKLKSPYFDYNNKEVITALNTFMNVLSQNISIKKPDFEPLLKKAVNETLLLIFSPFDYYKKEIKNQESPKIILDDLQEISNYVKINPSLLDKLLAQFKNKGVKEMSFEEGIKFLADTFQYSDEEGKEDYGDYFEKFSDVLPLKKEMVYEEEFPENLEKGLGLLQPKAEAREAPDNNPNFFKQHITLNEKLTSTTHSSIADLHARKKIDSIKKHISIYQRFMFINELFQGKVEEFENAVDTLENCNNYEEAMKFIKVNFINQYQWDLEAEEVNEFFDILSKRYN